MRKLLNTLYVTTEDSYLSLDGENVVVLNGDEVLGRVPLHNLESIVYFGHKGASPALMGKCVELGIGLSFLSSWGKFRARVSGPTQGNVVLRRTQVLWAENSERALCLAKSFLLGKLYNSRWVLERAVRDHGLRIDKDCMESSISQIFSSIPELQTADSVSTLMGIEGAAAKSYFDVFDRMILRNKDDFHFEGRSRRPPLDPVNAMLSFCYTLLGLDIASALEAVGLDPFIGFLHQLRPGRKSLSLDLLEELRAPLADRFVLSQINLGTVTQKQFHVKENGAVLFDDDGRRAFLFQWQKRKQETITHPFLKEKISWGLVPYVQAMLLSRYMRGDLDEYPPFLWK